MRRSGGVFAFLLAWAGTMLAQESVPTPAPATPAGSVRLKSRVVVGKPVSLARGAASTVTDYEKGKSITVKTPAGILVKYRLAKGASVPDDLAAGRTVLVETTRRASPTRNPASS